MKKRVLNAKGEMAIIALMFVLLNVIEVSSSMWTLALAMIGACSLMYIELIFSKGE